MFQSERIHLLPVFLLVITLFFNLSSEEGDTSFTLEKFEFENFIFNDYGNISGTIINEPRGKRNGPAFSLEVKTFVLIDNFSMRFTIFLSSNTCELCHKAVDQDIDYCKLIKRNKRNGFVRTAFNYIKNFGEVPLACPIPIGHYHFHNVTVNSKILPSYIPEGPVMVLIQANATIHGQPRTVPITSITFIGSVKRKGFGF